MKHLIGGVAAAALGLAASAASAQDDQTLMLRMPAVHGDTLVFVYAGDLWRSGLDGRDPVRLTSHAADERSPHISPDGRWWRSPPTMRTIRTSM